MQALLLDFCSRFLVSTGTVEPAASAGESYSGLVYTYGGGVGAGRGELGGINVFGASGPRGSKMGVAHGRRCGPQSSALTARSPPMAPSGEGKQLSMGSLVKSFLGIRLSITQ